MTSNTATLDITPDKSLMQKIGAVGYRTEQAVSEFIDNAIDARLPDEPEQINVSLDFVNHTITVSDDGRGMDLEDLRRGLTIARGRGSQAQAAAGLGTFGIGLKSACAALGKSFAIVTSTEGSKVECVAEYDEDEWLRDRERGWSNFEVRTRPRTGTRRGTAVSVSRLRVPLYPNQTTAFKKSFGLRYGAYIRSGQVLLHVNSRPCQAADPDVVDGSRRELEIPLRDGGVLRGWVGILEKRSIKGDYGMHLYRGGRLIRAFDKFGMRRHPEVARVVGELHLDRVPVNFYKSGFLVESPEYAECVDAFKRHPEVGRVMRSASAAAATAAQRPDSLVQSVLDYPAGGAAGAPLARAGRDQAGRIMKEASGPYSTRGDAGAFEVVFKDGADDELYEIGPEPGSGPPYRITINRNSPVFRTASNPLFLVGMIRAESEMLAAAGRAGDMAGLIRRRNRLWCRLAQDWSAPSAPPPRRAGPAAMRRRPPRLPGYGLADELVEMHDLVCERFADPFQFTALSTLARFLHYEHARVPYHMVAERGTGERLRDLVDRHWGGEFVVLLNPGEVEARTAMAVSDKDRFIMVRELAVPASGTWAGPAKAWLDLAAECKRRAWMAGYRQELAGILGRLIEDRLVEPNAVRAAAKSRRIEKIVDECIGGAH